LCTSVCPDYGVVKWLSGFLVPGYGRFSLIGDPDSFDTVSGVTLFLKSFDSSFNALFYRLNDLDRVMFMPSDAMIRKRAGIQYSNLPRLRIDLLEFDLMRCYGFSISIEDEKSRTSSTLVNRTNKDFL
jgi:hypothetical protein